MTVDLHEFLEGNTTASLIYTFCRAASPEEPITRQQLCRLTKKPDREVRDVITQLRRKGARIASSSGKAGYWFCQSESEYKAVRAEIIARALSCFEVVRAMDAATEGQMEMEWESSVKTRAT